MESGRLQALVVAGVLLIAYAHPRGEDTLAVAGGGDGYGEIGTPRGTAPGGYGSNSTDVLYEVPNLSFSAAKRIFNSFYVC